MFKTIVTKISERFLYGFGFGLGMSMSLKLVSIDTANFPKFYNNKQEKMK
tara:strand:- start:561 stop:710 length:150 start_codon:yes stop_codon:yes gene_type:complete